MTDENRVLTAPVGIVGGGPVGMVLALFLERYGVPSVLFNIEEDSRWFPKGNTHNARSMEHYRRLGLSDALRRVGLPHDHPTDVAYLTRLAAPELARIRMPSEGEKLAARAASARTDQVPEPLHRANQMYVEKVLFEHVGMRPLITRRYGVRVTAVAQDREGVRVAAARLRDGGEERWRFSYVVGCDGGQSVVRRSLGIHYAGFETLQQEFMGGRMIATYLRLPTALEAVIGRERRAWQYTILNPEGRMVLVWLDGRDEFLLFTPARDPSVTPDDAAIARKLMRAIGREVPVAFVGHNPWTAGVALVAERFGEGRLLLAGDAVHLFTPTGGFGMNTGIDDAANLAWKLWAAVAGWGGPRLLASYETERRPIAIRNTTEARKLAISVGELPIVPELEEESPAGAAARTRLGDFISAHLGEEFASLGIQLGARYDGSPIIVPDGAPPADDPILYSATSVPGGRAPHLWLDAGRGIGSSLYDRLGPGFTLLCLAGDAAPAAALAAARRRGVPLTVLALADAEARALYERDVVLVRPDQHVAWRGNALPGDCDALLDRVTGA